MKVVVDRFGEDVGTYTSDDNTFIVEVEIAVSPTFYSWVFNYCGKIQIIEPKSIKEEYQARIKEASESI
jgi:predicted DNA-binding transcriptional regulator YafY